MLSVYRLELALIISGLVTAFAGLGVTIFALFMRNRTAHLLARNLMAFSLLCLFLQSSHHC